MGNIHSLNACTYESQRTGPSVVVKAQAAVTASTTPIKGEVVVEVKQAETKVTKTDCGKEKCQTSSANPNWTAQKEAETVAAFQGTLDKSKTSK